MKDKVELTMLLMKMYRNSIATRKFTKSQLHTEEQLLLTIDNGFAIQDQVVGRKPIKPFLSVVKGTQEDIEYEHG